MSGATLEDLQALEKAIALGAVQVEYSDRKVTYRSLEDMYKIRKAMRTELGLNSTESLRRVAVTSKGLY